MVKVIVSILAMFCLLSPQVLKAQEAKFQSIFIYNFTRYIKWPESMMADDFVIGVVGSSDVYKELQTMAENKRQTQGMNMIINHHNSVTEVEKCHILFVSKDKLGELEKISSVPSLSSTLIITDSPGQAEKGSTINFVEVNGRIKFELNQDNAAKRNLKVSSSLISLAILV